jgi:hypothetical protein
MKKLLLSFGLLVTSAYSFGQIICNQTAPNPTTYTFSLPNSWGMDMTIPGNFVHDTLIVASDTLGCTTVTNSVAGKIAVIYRGSCNFTVKVTNAVAAGAVGVLIINNIAAAPTAMGGTDGAGMNVPIAQISMADGAAVRATMLGGPVKFYIGNKAGFFANDLTLTDIGSMRANVGSLPISLAQSGTEFSVPLGAWVFNQGQNDLTNITLSAQIKRNGTSVHNVTSATPVSILSGDSAFVTAPTYSPASHQSGGYEIIYSVASGVTDDFTNDNTNSNFFSLSDSLWSLCSLSLDTAIVSKQTYIRPATLPATQFESCIAFKNAHASRVAIDGIYFGGYAITATDTVSSLDGFETQWSLYTWDDPDFTLTNGTLDIISEVASGSYEYPANASASEQKTVFMPLTNSDQGSGSYRLDDNQQYLLCLTSFNTKLFMAYSDRDHYDEQFNTDDLIRFPTRSDATEWKILGFTGLPVPSIAVRTGTTLNVSENELVSASAFPVPAKEVITVKVNAAGNATLKIVDMAGRLVSTQAVKIENGQFQTSVEGMNSGTYVFSLDYSNGTSSRFNVVVSK